MPIVDNTLFIVERSGDNFKASAREINDQIPAFEPGVICVFHQRSAPRYWTQLTDAQYDGAALRVVNGSGAGYNISGKQLFHDVFKTQYLVPVGRHGHSVNDSGHSHRLTMTAHGHSVSDPGHTHPTSSPGGHSHTRPGGTNIDASGGFSSGSTGPMQNNNQIYPPSNQADCNFSPNTSRSTVADRNTTSSNMSIQVDAGSGSFTCRAVTNSSTPATIDPHINFSIKYINCIVCKKD